MTIGLLRLLTPTRQLFGEDEDASGETDLNDALEQGENGMSVANLIMYPIIHKPYSPGNCYTPQGGPGIQACAYRPQITK